MKTAQPRVLVLIPAFNEEARITATIQDVRAVAEVARILVVDDGSRDRTAQAASLAGAEVLVLPENTGKGEALNRGLAEFREDILVLWDADLGNAASELPKLLAPVLSGQADMTIAKFAPVKQPGGFGLVKGLARWGVRLFGGVWVEYPLSGQRVLTRQVVEAIGSFASGYGVEVSLTIQTARSGFRLCEVATELVHLGATGRNLHGFLHRGRQFWQIFWVLAASMKKDIWAGGKV